MLLEFWVLYLHLQRKWLPTFWFLKAVDTFYSAIHVARACSSESEALTLLREILISLKLISIRIGWEFRGRFSEYSDGLAWSRLPARNPPSAFARDWVGSVNLLSCLLHGWVWRVGNSGCSHVWTMVGCTSWHKVMCWAAQAGWGHHWVLTNKPKEPKKHQSTFTAPIWHKTNIKLLGARFGLSKFQMFWISFSKALVIVYFQAFLVRLWPPSGNLSETHVKNCRETDLNHWRVYIVRL